MTSMTMYKYNKLTSTGEPAADVLWQRKLDRVIYAVRTTTSGVPGNVIYLLLIAKQTPCGMGKHRSWFGATFICRNNDISVTHNDDSGMRLNSVSLFGREIWALNVGL